MHKLTVKVYDTDKDPKWHVVHGECLCGWRAGGHTKEGVEASYAEHLQKIENARYIVTVEGKEYVVKPEHVRRA